MHRTLWPITLLLAALALPAWGQQSERFDAYEIHYSVVNTTFLEPKVAETYNITRGKERAILNLAVREHLDDGTTEARSTTLKGRTWDLIQHTTEFQFQEVREGPAIYYIAEFRYQDEEWRHFEVLFRPDGAGKTYTLKFRQQVYTD